MLHDAAVFVVRSYRRTRCKCKDLLPLVACLCSRLMIPDSLVVVTRPNCSILVKERRVVQNDAISPNRDEPRSTADHVLPSNPIRETASSKTLDWLE